MARDDFTGTIKAALAKRVAYICANPICGTPTSGPHSDPERAVNIGVAAHITAASPGGPRFDQSLNPAQRASAENAIWLCQTCAKLVDNDADRFPANVLRHWKVVAEAEALRAVKGIGSQEYYPQPTASLHAPVPKIAGLTYDEARSRLIEAGWQPHMQHWSHSEAPDVTYGNGLHFWQRGYHEIINASGTGLGHCTFGFVDIYRNKLIVVTAGEVCVEENWNAHVWNWYLAGKDDA